jgi:hypothetical protein
MAYFLSVVIDGAVKEELEQKGCHYRMGRQANGPYHDFVVTSMEDAVGRKGKLVHVFPHAVGLDKDLDIAYLRYVVGHIVHQLVVNEKALEVVMRPTKVETARGARCTLSYRVTKRRTN